MFNEVNELLIIMGKYRESLIQSFSCLIMFGIYLLLNRGSWLLKKLIDLLSVFVINSIKQQIKFY